MFRYVFFNVLLLLFTLLPFMANLLYSQLVVWHKGCGEHSGRKNILRNFLGTENTHFYLKVMLTLTLALSLSESPP